MSTYCKCCGALIENDADVICRYCGNRIERDTPPQQYNQNPYGNQQYGQNPYGNQYGNPYGNQQYNQYNQNPYGGNFYSYNGDSVALNKANNSRILGIVSIFVNPFLILSIIAIVMANSATTLAPNNPEVAAAAKTGKICAIVSIALGILSVFLYIGLFAAMLS